jgi:hypothetical protein
MEARQAAKLAEMDLEEFLPQSRHSSAGLFTADAQDVLLLPADKIDNLPVQPASAGRAP